MAAETGCVFYIPGCDTDMIRHHVDSVQKQLRSSLDQTDGHQFVFLSCRQQFSCMARIHGYPQHLMALCRQYGLVNKDTITLLSPVDQTIAVQLCLAERNKQEVGDFDVEASIVLQAVKDINNKKLLSNYTVTSCTEESGICELYQNFLSHCNYMDACDVLNKLQASYGEKEDLRKQIDGQVYVILDSPRSPVERKVLEFLCGEKPVKTVSVEVPLHGEQSVTVTIRDSCLATIQNADIPCSTVKKVPSVTEAYIRLVYLSYLDLVVNSRSELSLARVFNVPERELTHTAFTDLKHMAKEKRMTIYQTAVSHVMKVRLGGKGYAPDPNSPLAPHIKGIGDFMCLMQRMETVLEEDPDIRSACRRTVGILRKEMLKCRDSKLRGASVESVAEGLQAQISTIIDGMEGMVASTPGKAACDGGSLTSRRARKALRLLLDKLVGSGNDLSALEYMTDIYSSQHTPLRFPSVMSQFRSPEEDVECASPEDRLSLPLSERVNSKTSKPETPVYAKRYKSTVDWAEPVHSVGLGQDQPDVFSASQVYVIPTKTIVHAGSKFSSGEANKVLESLLDQENVSNERVCADQPRNNASTVASNTDRETNRKTNKTNKAGKGNQSKSVSTDGALKQTKKRQLETGTQNASQIQKKKKGDQSNKSCRRKLLPQVKGQQQLTKFFRM